MKKEEFTEIFMAKAHLRNKEEAKRRVEFFIESIKEALVNDDFLVFRKLGTFEKRTTKRTVGRNPKTGETIEFSTKKYIKFKVGSELEAMINK